LRGERVELPQFHNGGGLAAHGLLDPSEPGVSHVFRRDRKCYGRKMVGRKMGDCFRFVL